VQLANGAGLRLPEREELLQVLNILSKLLIFFLKLLGTTVTTAMMNSIHVSMDIMVV